MKLLLRLAIRNLGRNRRRTALMIVIVAFSTWAIVVLWGITEGFFTTMIDAQIRLDTGALQIHRAGFLDDPDLVRALDQHDLSQVTAALHRRPAVQAFAARIKTEGLLKSAYGALGVEIRGLDPAAERNVSDVVRAIVAGRFIENAGEIVLGRPLAEELNVRMGERVVLETQGLKKAASRGLQLVGVLSTGLSLLDRSTALIFLDDARLLTGLAGATEIAIRPARGTGDQHVANQLRAALGEAYTVSTLFELNPLLADVIRAESAEMIPVMLLLALLAGFGVANTVMFTVLERTREFGVIMALGLQPRRLARLVLVESLLASGMGFLIGAAIGYGVVWYLARVGIDLGFFTDAFPDLGMPHVIYGATSGWYWLYGLSVVVLTALAAAWYPARRAAALEPTEAMRHA